LFKSCDIRHRREAIEKYEAFVADLSFSSKPPGAKATHLRELEFLKSHVQEGWPPCVVY
jgi:hypothetical protein